MDMDTDMTTIGLSPAWLGDALPSAADAHGLPLAWQRDAARMHAWAEPELTSGTGRKIKSPASSSSAAAAAAGSPDDLRATVLAEARKARASGRSVGATLDATLE